MEETLPANFTNLIKDLREIIEQSRENAVRSIDFCRVQMYWHLGRRIFEEEQQAKERVEYGTCFLKKIANFFEIEYGSVFSYR